MTSRRQGRASAPFSWIVLFLMVLAAVLLVGIVAGTVWACFSPTSRINSQRTSPESVQAMDTDGRIAVFAELGLLRLTTSDSPSITVVVSPFMPYAANDIAFQEELVRKTGTLKSVFIGWFGSHSALELKNLGEKNIKKKLIEKINSHLVLGQISALYFEEFTVFE